MSTVIEAEAVAAGLPPPLLLSVPEATRLAFVLQRDRTGPSAIQLVAARNGEGTSTLTRDLCLVLAANGSRTLLFAAETPVRRPDWPRSIYGMPGGLRPSADGPAGLQLLRVGETRLTLAAPSAAGLIQVPAWLEWLATLRRTFDAIVVDAPALERAFTAVMLAPHVDATAIVVAAESTRASAVRSLRDRLAEVGGEAAGVILNKRRFHVPRAAYERL